MWWGPDKMAENEALISVKDSCIERFAILLSDMLILSTCNEMSRLLFQLQLDAVRSVVIA